MSLADVVKSAVAAVSTATAGLQAEVSIESFIGDDSDGRRTYNDAETYSVILENKTRWVTSRDRNGESQLSKSNIQFLEAVTITEQDRITLPDGSQPQILSIEGTADPDGVMYAARVYF